MADLNDLDKSPTSHDANDEDSASVDKQTPSMSSPSSANLIEGLASNLENKNCDSNNEDNDKLNRGKLNKRVFLFFKRS